VGAVHGLGGRVVAPFAWAGWVCVLTVTLRPKVWDAK
jgi:hypothetical protein